MITQKTRAERGLDPYVSPKKAWDPAVAVPAAEVLVEKEPSSRKERRAQATNREVTQRKSQKRATAQWLKQRHEQHNLLGIARVYLNTDGAHERSPEVAKNATARVHKAAEAVSQRDGIGFEQALKVVEGDLLNVATSAGLR